MAIQSAAGTATPTPYAERLMGMLQFRKGAHFIGAALLLRQHGGEEYVVLHNLCQGLELIIKGLLLVKDFDSYRPKLGDVVPKAKATAMTSCGSQQTLLRSSS